MRPSLCHCAPALLAAFVVCLLAGAPPNAHAQAQAVRPSYAAPASTPASVPAGSTARPPADTAPVAPLTTGTPLPGPGSPFAPARPGDMAEVPGGLPGAPGGPQSFDYRANLLSDVFGAQLFTGAFALRGATQFNPDYVVASGDTLQVRLWGAYTYDAPVTVDPQGNIFLPYVGPVKVRGTPNQELQRVVDAAVRRVFRANVNSYASLAAAQPVRVFVGGNVYRPGLYSGTSMDSLLQYLDLAGGIDPERGSFLAVQVKRGSEVRATINLYDFLLQGSMPLVQLADGDVIFVPPRQGTVKVNGLAENAKRFEFFNRPSPGAATVAEPTVGYFVQLAKPQAQATHVRLTRNTGAVRNTEYYALAEASGVPVQSGDELEFTADKKPGTITVRVEGEHLSPQEYVLPYGSRMGELLGRIQFNERSESQSVQLFRLSVKDRQKEALGASLRSLEVALLTARSGSADEAQLRKNEADLTLKWIERAKAIEPLGQVVIAQASQRDNLLLENGDILRVPTRDGLVLVGGEVLFPNAVAFESGLKLQDYIDRAGGYTQKADDSRVVVARRDGSFVQTDTGRMLANTAVLPGDQVLVLPKVDDKPRQFWKELTQIIFQIAVSARIAVGL